MKSVIIIFALVVFFSSCKKVYDPDINADQYPLVVDGLITDEFQPGIISLRRAVPYDSTGMGKPVPYAKVSIIDDNGNIHKLTETGSGVYITNPAQFVARPGRNYTLHIETIGGDIYESTPQLMLPNDFTDSTYAVKTIRESLIENYYGDVMKTEEKGMDLMMDIKARENVLSRFRFTIRTAVEYQYEIVKEPAGQPPFTIHFDCWEQTGSNDIPNITDEKYRTSSFDIKNHSVTFLPDELTRYASFEDSTYTALITDRIVRVTRFRINPETFDYYKNINKQLSAGGKIFDPVPGQLKGNITCLNHPGKLALGFFEASSVNVSAYHMRTGTTKLIAEPNVTLPLPECKIDTIRMPN